MVECKAKGLEGVVGERGARLLELDRGPDGDEYRLGERGRFKFRTKGVTGMDEEL